MLEIKRLTTALAVILLLFSTALALQPEQILIIANADNPDSMDIAAHYSQARGVENILKLNLGKDLADDISRADYNRQIAHPIRQALQQEPFKGKIRCLITTYGIPYRIGNAKPVDGWRERIEPLEQMEQQAKEMLEELENPRSAEDRAKKRRLELQLWRIQAEMNRLRGRETGAALDSELSMVMHEPYELFRWQINELRGDLDFDSTKTIMVSRLDGPSLNIAKRLVDKAMIAEATGPEGNAYVDSRGIEADDQPGSFGYYDQSLRDMAELLRSRTPMTVIEETTSRVFQEGDCPETALYCGWYSLSEYVPAFEFVTGAVGYHIASFEAVDLRDPQSTQWVPSMLREGITATLGPVAEPYLHAFPLPHEFFAALLDGDTLAQAYYRTKPFNSWQMLLIGDPLYRPFRNR